MAIGPADSKIRTGRKNDGAHVRFNQPSGQQQLIVAGRRAVIFNSSGSKARIHISEGPAPENSPPRIITKLQAGLLRFDSSSVPPSPVSGAASRNSCCPEVWPSEI